MYLLELEDLPDSLLLLSGEEISQAMACLYREESPKLEVLQHLTVTEWLVVRRLLSLLLKEKEQSVLH